MGWPALSNEPDRLLPLHTASWASLQLFGVIQLYDGVSDSFCRSRNKPFDGSSRLAMWAASQSVPPSTGVVSPGMVDPAAVRVPVMEWNHANGECLATYWSLACAPV